MTPTDTSHSDSSPSGGSPQHLAAMQLPIENPVEEFSKAVKELRQCDLPGLRRRRKHHRRALSSLQNGGYDCLSDPTRRDLTDRLRNNLAALNKALEAFDDVSPSSQSTDDEVDSLSDRVRSFFRRLW